MPLRVGAEAHDQFFELSVRHPGQHALPRHALARGRRADPSGVRLRGDGHPLEEPRAPGGRVCHAESEGEEEGRGGEKTPAQVPRGAQARPGRDLASRPRRRRRQS